MTKTEEPRERAKPAERQRQPGTAEPQGMRSRCELCGETGRPVYIFVIGDFIGMACGECVRQLRKCQVRRYCSTGEETEPGE